MLHTKTLDEMTKDDLQTHITAIREYRNELIENIKSVEYELNLLHDIRNQCDKEFIEAEREFNLRTEKQGK